MTATQRVGTDERNRYMDSRKFSMTDTLEGHSITSLTRACDNASLASAPINTPLQERITQSDITEKSFKHL